MRKLAVILTLIACCSLLGYAQEEPIPPKRSRMVKVGLFGGFTPGVLFPDVKPINEFLKGGGAAPLNTDGVFMLGGAGAAYIMIVPNLRVGGVGMSGHINSTALDAATNIRKDAELHVGYGGVTIEYVIPIMERFDFAVGAMLGAGGIDLTLRQSNGVSNTWGNEQDYLKNGFGAVPANPPGNVTRVLSGSFFVYVPAVSFEYAISGWFAVRLGASYVGMAAPSWSVDSNYDLLGVPGDVKGSGFMVNMGLLVGTF